MGIEDTQIKILEEVVKYLEDDKVEKELKTVRNIAKKYSKSVQEIKAILARVGDDKSKQLLKQIIELQVPNIEEITRKYIKDEYSSVNLSEEYGIYRSTIGKYICEYAFATGQEKQYNMRRKHKSERQYKSKDIDAKNTQENSTDIDSKALNSQNLIQEGEDR